MTDDATEEMNHKIGADQMRHAANARCYAIGRKQGNGFQVRKVVWGWLMAKSERRTGEIIKRAIVLVESGAK